MAAAEVATPRHPVIPSMNGPTGLPASTMRAPRGHKAGPSVIQAASTALAAEAAAIKAAAAVEAAVVTGGVKGAGPQLAPLQVETSRGTWRGRLTRN